MDCYEDYYKIKRTDNQENFEELDDYILWESYIKVLQYCSKLAWQLNKKQGLR